MTESGVFDDEFSSGTQAEIGYDLERFNPVPKRGKVGPETADSTAEQCGDGSHGQFGITIPVAGPGQPRLIYPRGIPRDEAGSQHGMELSRVGVTMHTAKPLLQRVPSAPSALEAN